MRPSQGPAFPLRLLAPLTLLAACGPAGGAPPTGPATQPPPEVPRATTSLPNTLVDGPLPGCVDAFELVNQTLTLPAMPITFDPGGVIDRIATSAAGVTYTFALRPVQPIDCSPTTLPASPPTSVSFDFTYLGDFTRTDPFCMNGSRLTLTGFTITGTPLDSVISIAAHGLIWVEIDRALVSRLDALLGNGTFGAGADPRCSNWAGF